MPPMITEAEAEAARYRDVARCERLTAELHAIVGRPFNINSPIQLRDILYTERGLAPGKKTKTGYSTDAASAVMTHGQLRTQ